MAHEAKEEEIPRAHSLEEGVGTGPERRSGRWCLVLRRWVGRLVALALGCLFCLLLLETLLRVRPQLFNNRFQNLAFSKYDGMPNGIYLDRFVSRSIFMKPDFETRAFLNGHWWSHRTDSYGFRNPDGLDQKDVLLLGDSLVYGHGVEENQTVSHFLRELHGHAAYNMGRQGTCLYDAYVAIRTFMDEFKPKVVLLFVFINDFQEVESRRGVLLEARPEIAYVDYELLRERLRELSGPRSTWASRTLFRFHSVRLFAKTYVELRRKWRSERPNRKRMRQEPQNEEVDRGVSSIQAQTPPLSAAASARLTCAREVRTRTYREAAGHRQQAKESQRGHVPRFVAAINDSDRFGRIGRYYEAILEDLKSRCMQRQVRLVLVNLHLPRSGRGQEYYDAQEAIRRLLKTISQQHEIELVDTGEAFRDGRGCYLPLDGHLSEKGHRLLADFLHRQVLSRPPDPNQGGMAGESGG